MIDTGTLPMLRELHSIAEMKQAERFQKEVWGENDPPDNADILQAIQHEGGIVAGAFVGGRMLGFLFGFPTSQLHIQHSHRLAVHPDARGLGLGLKLKWFQRDWCLARGITHVRWTYDPVRRINASLNIARLGGTSNTYYEDYYGAMEGINAGVPSDRLLVDWHLDAPGVVARAKDPCFRPQIPHGATGGDEILRVTPPADFQALLDCDLDLAIAERLRVRQALTERFRTGYQITGFDAQAGQYWLTRS